MGTSRILLTGASVAANGKCGRGALLIVDDRIGGLWFPDEEGKAVFNGSPVPFGELPAAMLSLWPDLQTRDLDGKVVMAGGIDAHVHFREPGMAWKGDLASESKAALLGGITSFIDMPNTVPATTDILRLEEKCALADGRCAANWGFHIGATNGNIGELKGLLSSGRGNEFCGIKVFMGSSTGNMLVDDNEALDQIFQINGCRILIHSEDEGIIKANLKAASERYGDNIPFSEHPVIRSRTACIKSTIKALETAMRYGTKLHVTHVTTAEEVEMIRTAKSYNPEITAETSVNYLWFCDEDYEKYGGRMKCNPAVKTARDREALRNAVKDGIIDTIGSDHAPHLPEEKDKPYANCPSGIPSIEQELSVLLTIAGTEGIGLERVASLMSERASGIFGIRGRGILKEGNYADVIVIDPEKEFTVGENCGGASGIDYKCGWTPYSGTRLKGIAEDVYLNGELVVDGGRLLNGTAGRRLVFEKP